MVNDNAQVSKPLLISTIINYVYMYIFICRQRHAGKSLLQRTQTISPVPRSCGRSGNEVNHIPVYTAISFSYSSLLARFAPKHMTSDEGWGHEKLESCRRNKNLDLVLMDPLPASNFKSLM